MRISSALRIFYKASGKQVLAMPVILMLISSCADLKIPEKSQAPDQYNADELAREWRAQVRQNPHNPYEGRSFPADNDSEYSAPKKRTQKNSAKTYGKQPSQNNMPAYEDNDDSSYGRFPRYNPDDDNAYPSESKDYPLYLD